MRNRHEFESREVGLFLQNLNNKAEGPVSAPGSRKSHRFAFLFFILTPLSI